MRRAARLHADETKRQLREERQNLRPSQRPPDGDIALRINGMNLENALGQIEADRANLHLGGSHMLVNA